ncbi:hypothetical protein [Stieleria mannarensis]|uniref:hypothetical protein n=1 Tax=Stieleria mannarensis TaxID=2755585 RepID=UPI001600EA70|nr:hypothetical protein [Rhodopirellula sp. JC639]
MARQKYTAAICCVILLACSRVSAQTNDSLKPSRVESAETDPVSVVDSVEAAYRELICSRAADETDANQDQAIDLALQQRFVDARFDAIIRQSMQNAPNPQRWNVEELSQAVKLLPLCTLDPVEQAELVFRCYLECGDSKADYSLRKELRQVLRRHPNPTSRLVNERLQQGDDPKSVLPLVDIVGDSTEATLPLLMDYAKSDEPEIAAWAMGKIPELIEQVRKLKQQSDRIAEQRRLGIEGLDSKMVEYAKRIIGRYDVDGDQELSPEEYAKMLQSPAEADTDENGRISWGEYAAWMQSRYRRRQ